MELNNDIDLLLKFINKTFCGYEKNYHFLLDKCDLFVFGGAIRDIVFFKTNQVRDLDIVVSGISNENLSTIFNRSIIRRTRFGGVNCLLRDVFLDIWSLEETWAIRKKYFTAEPKNLPYSVFLSTDGIIFDIKNKLFIESAFFKSFEKKEIDIVFEKNPFPALSILRAFVQKKKYNLSLSEKLCQYIIKYFQQEDEPLNDIYHIQKSHYGKEMLSVSQIIFEYKMICDLFDNKCEFETYDDTKSIEAQISLSYSSQYHSV
ncbi:MAG: hypothetical protein ABSA44_11615 [Bacteroidota bacterium]